MTWSKICYNLNYVCNTFIITIKKMGEISDHTSPARTDDTRQVGYV